MLAPASSVMSPVLYNPSVLLAPADTDPATSMLPALVLPVPVLPVPVLTVPVPADSVEAAPIHSVPNCFSAPSAAPSITSPVPPASVPRRTAMPCVAGAIWMVLPVTVALPAAVNPSATIETMPLPACAAPVAPMLTELPGPPSR